MVLFASTSTAATAAPKFKAKTTLVGQSVMKGQARVHEKHGALRLDVHVLRAGAFQTYDVWINDDIVGQIFTNPGGSGRLRVNRPLHSIQVGDVVSVGQISGALARPGSATVQTLNLSGQATAGDGMQSNVRYREATRGSSVDRTFVVCIKDGEPFQSVPVFVNGIFIAPMLPDEDGRAQLRMRTAAFIDDDDAAEWQPLPDDFPWLREGDQVQVGTSFVTLRN